MKEIKKKILVIGAGVMGLTCAQFLLERGFDVTIYAKSLSPNNCSDVGCAIWEPYMSEPWHRIEGWSKFSLHKYRNLLQKHHDAESLGLRYGTGYYLSKHFIDLPKWVFDKDFCVKFIDKSNDKDDILQKSKHDYYDHAMQFITPCIDPSIFLPWLLKNFLDSGGKLKLKRVSKINGELLNSFDAVANCCGLGALELCPDDKEVYPRRGQLILMSLPKVKNFYTDLDSEEAGYVGYIIPRNNYCCLGGTTQFNNSDKSFSLKDQKKILELCGRMVPEVLNTPILGNVVGLRPGRTEVRLEGEMIEGKLVVHNYGHGGAGWTLCWGCANEVADLVESHFNDHQISKL
jgi:D-amino-acid oxidase